MLAINKPSDRSGSGGRVMTSLGKKWKSGEGFGRNLHKAVQLLYNRLVPDNIQVRRENRSDERTDSPIKPARYSGDFEDYPLLCRRGNPL